MTGLAVAKVVKKAKAAFTLIELVLVAVLLGVIAMIAIPRFGSDATNRLAAVTTAREIASDMRLARSLAISNAGTTPQGYALQMTGGPPYSGYRIVNLTTGAPVSTKTIAGAIVCTGDSEFGFSVLGSLLPGSGTALLVSGDGKQYALALTPATASVTIQEQ